MLYTFHFFAVARSSKTISVMLGSYPGLPMFFNIHEKIGMAYIIGIRLVWCITIMKIIALQTAETIVSCLEEKMDIITDIRLRERVCIAWLCILLYLVKHLVLESETLIFMGKLILLTIPYIRLCVTVCTGCGKNSGIILFAPTFTSKPLHHARP